MKAPNASICASHWLVTSLLAGPAALAARLRLCRQYAGQPSARDGLGLVARRAWQSYWPAVSYCVGFSLFVPFAGVPVAQSSGAVAARRSSANFRWLASNCSAKSYARATTSRGAGSLSAYGRLTAGRSGLMDCTADAHVSIASTTPAWLFLMVFRTSL